jgi:hypothetical protein
MQSVTLVGQNVVEVPTMFPSWHLKMLTMVQTFEISLAVTQNLLADFT